MIHIERSSGAAPKVLDKSDPRSPGVREDKRAEAFFRELRRRLESLPAANDDAGEVKKSFNFRAYKHEEVKQALRRLFHGKCAYCESRYAGTQPMDVEHFRPKSEVIEEDGTRTRPAYYWLAAEWTNLLPSCIDCNRARNHRVEPSGETLRLGKETLFPLAPGSPRAASRQELAREKPLLLDPCKDRPEEILEFSEGVVGPRKGQRGSRVEVESALSADASIRVYGLNRTELVQDRRAVLLRIRQRQYVIRQILVLLEDYLPPEAGDEHPRRASLRLKLEDLLSREIDALLALREADQPFAQMARQEIESFESEL